MAKVTITIPSVSWRDGRPRYNPGPETRRRYGLKGQDLKHPDGRWFSAEEAAAWVAKLREDLAAVEGKARPKAALQRARAAGLGPSLGSLGEAYLASPGVTGGQVGKRRHKGKAPATIAFYRQKLELVRRFDPELYDGPAAALSKPLLRALYERLWEVHGLANARAAIASTSAVLSWAIAAGKLNLPYNPAQGLKMETPAPRERAGTPEEIRQLIAAADLEVYPSQRKGWNALVARPEVGDMVILGVWTGQRQGDRLAMTEETLAAGRVVELQNKTKARVDFIQSPELKARIAAIKARRLAWKKKPDQLVANSVTEKPFGHRTDYPHVFERVRAAAGLEETAADPAFARWALAPMPSLADFQDRDLRSTCVTWLARAGCNPIQIAHITGHSLQTVHQILKHYLVAHPEIGDQAIAQLVTWFEAQQVG
jgi:integrase